MEKVIKRGYVKWTDDDGVMHKEPLHEHPDLLGNANAAEQIRAEEVRRLNEAAKRTAEETSENVEEAQQETLEELKAAPEDVLTAADLERTEPASAAEEPVTGGEETSKIPSDERQAALADLREKTS